jgi:hypothetical protein
MPRSLRKRLRDAAISDNVAEIKRLHALDMADARDYASALPIAIHHGSIAAATQLWECVDWCKRESDAKEENEPHDTDDYMLACAALQAPQFDSLRLAVQYIPDVLIKALAFGREWNARTVPNLIELAHIDTQCYLYTKQQHQELLDNALKLIREQGAEIREHHVARICYALDRGETAMERMLLELVLPTFDWECHRESLLDACCTDQPCNTGKALRVVIGARIFQEADANYAITCASDNVAWPALDVCLELLPNWSGSVSRAECADTIIFRLASEMHWQQRHWTSAMGRVLARLLPHTTHERLLASLRLLDHTSFVMFHYLHERLFLCAGAMPETATLPHEHLVWLLRRNPQERKRLSAIASFADDDAAQQERRKLLHTYTPLASALIELVLSSI